MLPVLSLLLPFGHLSVLTGSQGEVLLVTGFAGLIRVHWTGTLFGVLLQVQVEHWTSGVQLLLPLLFSIRARDLARWQRQIDL